MIESLDTKIQKELLEEFILYNPELEKLEAMLSEFNLFETLNMVNNELRHSSMLSWLMNPNENHGLGSYFIHNFLKQVIIDNKSSIDNLSIFDIENMDYGEVEIQKEWKNIDILVVINEMRKQYVFVIENKIKTSEHDNQLSRYYSEVENAYPKAEKIYIYLTPDNADASEETWISFNYSSIADLLDNILQYRIESLGENIYSFIKQYIHILKRYLVGQSEIEKICNQIYKKHKAALDIIFEFRPDIQNEISAHLQGLIKKEPDLIIDGNTGKSVIRFTTHLIDEQFPKEGEGWVKSNRIVLYEISIYIDKVILRLYIGPGDQTFRKKVNDFVIKNEALFNKSNRPQGLKHHCIYQKQFLVKKDFEDMDQDGLIVKIEQKWKAFLSRDKPDIDKFLEGWED